MGTPLEPVIIAEQGGLVVAERGPQIMVVDRGEGPAQITAFVLLIITMVCCGFGVASIATAPAASAAPVPRLVSAVIFAVGAVAGAAMMLCLKRLRTRRKAPLTAFAPVAVFDRAHRTYRDGAGNIVAPLDQVRFERRMQMTSSSPKLVAVTPSGTYVLKRGNPFGGGIGALDRVLTDAVHGSRN